MNGLDFQGFGLAGAILVLFTALLLLTIQDWRVSLTALSIQYVGVFALVAIHWPLTMAFTKLVAGWIATAVLGTAVFTAVQTSGSTGRPATSQTFFQRVTGLTFSAWIFRIITAAMIVLVVLTMAPAMAEWVPGVEFEQMLGALFLIGLGLLHLGLTASPFRVVMALLTTLSGFEIIYAAVEVSTLVAGLLAGVSLGLALIGAYLLVSSMPEEEA